MSRANNPAFAQRELVADLPEYAGRLGGLTIREYFAGLAPKEPQAWFKPVVPPKPSRAGGYDEAAEMAWSDEYAKQFYIQWPVAWADALIAELAKEKQS
jgi:hypothetical protein